MTDSQMDTPELLPCPFCGNVAKVDYIRDGRQVICTICAARGPSMFHGPLGKRATKELAIAAWNRRAAPTALATDPAVKALVAEAVAEERERCVMAARLAMVNNPQADEFTCSICAAAIRKRETP